MARLAASARFFSSSVFLGEVDELLLLLLSSRRESLSSATLALQLLLAFGEALLACPSAGDVGADADEAAVLACGAH